MNKKSVSASILVMFLALVFAVVGACFAIFVYKDKMIKFQEIKVVAASSIEVFDDEKLENKISKLKLSDMKLGLKPATGDLDEETKIPSTITDKNGSEGYYEKIYVKSSVAFKVLVTNIKIENDKDKEKAEKEREHIFVAIKGTKNSTKPLQEDVVEIATFEGSEDAREIVFLFWLDALSGDELVGSKISFDIEFKPI
ncbi:MAG: hypothetical protein IKD36_02165 [Clostridia bacterium]|nr:hypothetical protein [Clostridia bacterium]